MQRFSSDVYRERLARAATLAGEAGLDGILLYIGGNLSVSRQNRRWEDIEAEFKALGFDRVYPQDVKLAQVVADLRQDLGLAA